MSEIVGHLLGFLDRDARRELHLHPDGPFVERRQEVFAHSDGEGHRATEDNHKQDDDRARFVQDVAYVVVIAVVEAFEPAVVIELAGLVVGQIGKPRSEEQGGEQGTDEGVAHGVGHGGEELALDMFEGEEGEVGSDDDDGGEEDGACHLAGPLLHIVGGELQFGMPFAFLQDVLHHHDGTVDQYAEVDGTKRKQVGRYACELHQHEGHQQGDGYGDGHHQGATEVAQEYHQHHDNQQHADKEGVGDGLEGGADEVGAVEEGMDFHPWGKYLVVQLVNRGMHAVEHFGGVFATEHLHDALDGVVVVALVVRETEDSFAFEVAVLEFAQLFEIDGGAVDALHHNVAQAFQVADEADAAHHVAEAAFGEDAATGVEVVLLNLLGDVGEGDAVFGEAFGGELNLILGGDAAVVAHVGHTGYLAEVGDDGPLVDVGEAAEVVAAVGAFHYVTVDFARGGREGVELGDRTIGEVDAHKAFVDTLARPIVVDSVVEHQYDGGDAEAVLAAHGDEVGDAA